MTKRNSGRNAKGQFVSGPDHPRTSDLSKVMNELLQNEYGRLRLRSSTIRREGRYRKIDADCVACGRSFSLYVDALLSGKTTNCRCQRAKKYHDPRSVTLGRRYDAIVQRCERDTHVSSHNYKGRGIKNKFRSREHFVRWALKRYPYSDFEGLDFDRIDNDGHYEPDNLRLVDRSTNLLNRERRKNRCKS